MSVLTYHEIQSIGGDLFDRLVKEGVIHPDKIYSPKSHEWKQFAHVFDYTKCNAQALKRLEERQVEHNKLFEESLDKFYNYTPEEKANQIAENNKCDFRLMPVSRSKAGGVVWVLNYASDSLPAVAIEFRYPEEYFEYYQEIEGETDCYVQTKNGEIVKDLYMPNETSLDSSLANDSETITIG